MPVEFEEENLTNPVSTRAHTPRRGMAGWLVDHGWLPSEKAANVFLVVGAVLIMSVSVIFFRLTFSQSSQQTVPQSLPNSEVIKYENLPEFENLPAEVRKSLIGK